MTEFTLFGQAEAPAAQVTTVAVEGAPAEQARFQQGGFASLLPIIVVVVIFLFFISRSNKKQQQKRAEELSRIMKGDRVMISGGIFGEVVEVKDETFVVEIAPKVNVEIVKSGVNAVPKAKEAAAVDPKSLK